MVLLIEFLLRLTFGLAGSMALVSPRQVSSGYFRNHLYVTLGLSLLAALLCYGIDLPVQRYAFRYAVAAAILSYVGSVLWLYERPLAGRLSQAAVSSMALVGAALVSPPAPPNVVTNLLGKIQVLTSGWLLGVTMAAMLLGHWYLNSPGMQLAPLRRLLAIMAAAVAVQIVVSGVGLGLELGQRDVSLSFWLFVALRWLFGLLGVVILIWMAWQTLKIPNTQSATGILYVAVIGTFVGETMSLLLSRESVFPL